MGSKTFGQLEEFNSRTDSFQAYVERANLYFEVNGIKEEKQLAVLLSSIGGKPMNSCKIYWLPHYQKTSH